MNWEIFIMEIITDIENTVSEYMHSRYSNVDSEGFIMFHGTVGMIKINALNLRTPIFTVACNTFPCIRAVAFLNNLCN